MRVRSRAGWPSSSTEENQFSGLQAENEHIEQNQLIYYLPEIWETGRQKYLLCNLFTYFITFSFHETENACIVQNTVHSTVQDAQEIFET